MVFVVRRVMFWSLARLIKALDKGKKRVLNGVKMLDTFFETKFYAKCKSYIKLTKTRLVAIKNKRNTIEKYMKNDVAVLLRNGLYYNACDRAEALLVEQNITSCYYLTEHFCDYISNHLSVMDKQRECPEDCREAVASLIHAAARFSDLPDLQALRSLFTQKYGSSIESYINKDFNEKLRASHPTKDMKLQLIQGIAHELSIDWNSKALEQQLFCPAPPFGHNHQQLSNNEDIDGLNGYAVKNGNLSNRARKDARSGRSNLRDHLKLERNCTYNPSSSSEDEIATVSGASSRDNTDIGGGLKSSSSKASILEDHLDSRRPSPYRLIPPPYTKPNNKKYNNDFKGKRTSHANGKENQQNKSLTESHPKPLSIRRPLKLSPHHRDIRSGEIVERHISQSICVDANNQRDEDGRMDELSTYYISKCLPYANKEKEVEQSSIHEPGIGPADRFRGTDFESFNRDGRGIALSPEFTNPKMPTAIHSRATSLQPDMLPRHVHPKLPDYDELVARFATRRGK